MTRAHWLGTTLLAMAAITAPTFAQSVTQPKHEHSTPAPQGEVPDGGKMGQHHQQMMAKMMADVTAREARLDTLVSAMNAATGEQKLNATAALLTQLVSDLKSAHHHMIEMHGEMKAHKP